MPVFGPEPQMDTALATELLQTLANPTAQRARLFDSRGRLVADSDWMADRVETKALPPAHARGEKDLMPGRAATRGVQRRALLQVSLDEGRARALELFHFQRVGRGARQRPYRLARLLQLPTNLTTQRARSADDEIHASANEAQSGSRRARTRSRTDASSGSSR